MQTNLPRESIWIDKKTKKLNVNIWPKQKMFLDADDIDELLFGGAVGGGAMGGGASIGGGIEGGADCTCTTTVGGV